jgi:hypothetical protein
LDEAIEISMSVPNKDELIHALNAAGSAHHDYETHFLNGVLDEHWPGWYAAYVIGKFGEFTTPTNLTTWLSQAKGDPWSEAAAKYVLDQL